MKALNLKIFFFAAALSVAPFATSAYAQVVTPPPQSAPVQLTDEQKMERRIEHLQHMQKKLGLTDNQVAQIKSIWQANKAKLLADRQAFQSASGAARRAAHKQLNADRKSTMGQVKGVLTADQQKKFAEIREVRRERRQDRKLHHTSPASGTTPTN
jgi:Spy/CpxP family protein refolding chaperone